MIIYHSECYRQKYEGKICFHFPRIICPVNSPTCKLCQQKIKVEKGENFRANCRSCLKNA